MPKDKSDEVGKKSHAAKDASRDKVKKSSSKKEKKTVGTESSLPMKDIASGGEREDPTTDDYTASLEFEAGLLFERYAKRNAGSNIDPHDFQRFMKENINQKKNNVPIQELNGSSLFEIGQLFERYDINRDGKLSKDDFQRLMKSELARKYDYESPDLIRSKQNAFQRDFIVDQRISPIPLHEPNQNSPARYNYQLNSFTHFNETTGVPLCQEAVSEQTSLGHTVVALHEAYSRRKSKLQTAMSTKLMPVREQLLQYRRQLIGRSDEIKSAKGSIERETLADSNAILERLRSAETVKLSSIDQKMNEVLTELSRIDKLAQQIELVTSSNINDNVKLSSYTFEFECGEKMIDLIQNYGTLARSMEKIYSTSGIYSLTTLEDIDFPHETAERFEVIRRVDRYEKALAVKDQVIWNLMQENSRAEEKVEIESNLHKEYADEVSQWAELTNKLMGQIAELKMQAERVPLLERQNRVLEEQNRLLLAKLRYEDDVNSTDF